VLSVIGFVVILIPLVVVHELGHFLFAKLFNVRADAFSIGFGPVLYARKFGETDFRVSAIPLGGYVKLLGEDPSVELPESEKKRALHNQPPWKRFFIFFGGPLFNFIWAALVFMVMMAIGEPQVATVIGRVLPDTTAAKVGFMAGDKITAVDGAPVNKLEDFAMKLADKPAQEVKIDFDRAGSAQSVKVLTTSEEGFSIYGEKKAVGSIDGIVPNPRMTKIGISNPDSVAGKAGLKTGEEIATFNGQPVTTFEQIENLYRDQGKSLKSEITLGVRAEGADEKAAPREVKLSSTYSNSLAQDFGISSSELFVEQAMKDSPAQKAGIQKGDHLMTVNSTPVRSFYELRQQIQKAGEDAGKVTIAVERAGKPLSFEIIPQVSSERDPLLKKVKQFTIGVMPIASMMDASMIKERVWNPFLLIYRGTARMLDLSARNLISIVKMFKGEVSVKSLGGPILIGKLAGDSLSHGLLDFLKMMAVLSIGLGVLNILPVPVLDGGHIVLLGIEAVRGRALSMKQIEICQQVGLVMILLLMGVVMKNDISRLPIFN
jgi:regulator of sigma E protease